MRIVITGTPATGKTKLAKELGKKLKLPVINELAFCQKNHVGKLNPKTGEREIPVPALTRKLNRLLKTKTRCIIEGHVVCECKLRPIDAVIVIQSPLKKLEKRLKKRGYSDIKILDNLWSEKNGYCLKKARQNYPTALVWPLSGRKAFKTICKLILAKINRLKQKRGTLRAK
ncbi:MAG: AAA family ATPase [Candidatus Micrarchaeota archaeon]